MEKKTKAVKKVAAPKAEKAAKAPKAAPKADKKSLSYEATVYTAAGKSAGTVQLSEGIFGLKWNSDLVHQVMHSMMSNARDPIAHTKTRGEVRGGGKKPWRQKGTGRARHGSTRSPIWVGGGIAHGPRSDKNFSRKINKTMKAKALFTVLSRKYRDGEVLFVDSISIKEPKTAEAVKALQSLSKVSGYETLATKSRNAAVIALSKKDVATEKSFRNIGSVVVDEARNMNVLDLLNTKYVIIENPVETMKFMEAKIA